MMAKRLLVLVLALVVGPLVVVRPPDASAAMPPTQPVVVRASDWYVRDSVTSGIADHTFTYGLPGDFPLLGDWDGDGDATPGVVRGATWYLRNTLGGGPADISFAYGYPGDYPVVGDWDGNGTATVGVKRGGTWLLRNSNSTGGVDLTVNYGLGTDLGFAGPGAISRDRGGKGLPPSLQDTELTRLATTSKLVALTFDAGANADGVPSILDTLQRTGTPATFFLTGTWPTSSRARPARSPPATRSATTPGTTPTCPPCRTRPCATSSSEASRQSWERPDTSQGRCSAFPSGSGMRAPSGS